MHTAMVMAGGFALLGICLLVGKTTGALAKVALTFIPLWLIGAGSNMWVGVAKTGYTEQQELPILLVIFAVPAAVALVLWRKLKSS